MLPHFGERAFIQAIGITDEILIWSHFDDFHSLSAHLPDHRFCFQN